MTRNSRKSYSFWVWIVIGLIVATLALGTLYYIGWFDNNTHVDTPAGDNVEQQYELSESQAEQPGEADWQNAGGQSFIETVTEPQVETQTPPAGDSNQQ